MKILVAGCRNDYIVNIMIEVRGVFNIVVSVICGLMLIQQAFGGERDTIGWTDLIARKPGADGSGVRIGQVEASSGDNYQPNPSSANQNSSKFSYFDETNNFPTAGAYLSSRQLGHANSVANNYYDLNTGIATDASEIYVFPAIDFYSRIITSAQGANSLDIGTSVVNQSFVFNASAETFNFIAVAYDNYAARHEVLFVNGTNNGSSTEIATPGTMFNGITVGREDLGSSTGPTFDGRSKPDLIAPGSAASFSAPYVAGSAAVLIEAARLNEGGQGTAEAASDMRTVKALLINGAVKTSSWSNTSTRPLDTRRGAGVLQIDHSYAMLEGGKHDSTTSADVLASNGPVHTPDSGVTASISSSIGWDFNAVSNAANGNQVNDHVENYYFRHENTTDLVATLTWNKAFFATDISNFDLYLFNSDTGAVVDSSVSEIDNVEHLFSQGLPAGNYVIQVVRRGAGAVGVNEEYALVFRFTDPAPIAPSNLVATATSSSAVTLTWVDNSNDELSFEIERSVRSGRSYNTIATVNADVESYTDTGLAEESTFFYRVKATNNAGDSFYSNVASVTTPENLSVLDAWRLANFGISSNTGIAANDQDFDNDGLNNLTEFALGTDPTSAKGLDGALAQPRASIVVIEDVEYLQYIANRASNRPEVNYFVDVCDDLVAANWVEVTRVLEDTDSRFRVRDNVPISSGPTRFMRLRVEENTDE